MKISKALKENNARLSYGDKWLVWSNIIGTNAWVVMQRKYRQKNTRTLLITNSEEEAVEELLKGEAE